MSDFAGLTMVKPNSVLPDSALPDLTSVVPGSEIASTAPSPENARARPRG